MKTQNTHKPVSVQAGPGHQPWWGRRARRGQSGFTLGELLLVLVIIGVLAVVAFRSVQPIIISGRVEATATDTNNAVQRIISAANSGVSGTAINYSTVTTAVFSAMLTASNMFRVNAGAITHRLSTGTAPTVTVDGTVLTNAGLALTFNQVHDAACIDLASLLQTAAVLVTVNGTTVKNSTIAAAVAFNGATAAVNCTAGSTNTLVFTFQ